MERIQWIEKDGIRILLEDFSNMDPDDDFPYFLSVAKGMIHAQPEHSVLALFDATGSRFNNKVLDQVKTFTDSNTPYIKAAAVVGIQGLLNIALQAVSRFAGRSFKVFATRDEAMEWLITQQ